MTKATVSTRGYRSVPMIVAPAPVNWPAIKPSWAVKSIARPIKAVAWAEKDAEANRRRVKHRPRRRWRRVIVTRRGSAIWLDRICAGARTQSSSKPECEKCQCCNDDLFPHSISLCSPADLTQQRLRSCQKIAVAENCRKAEGKRTK
jgi:hypothetical protein